MIWQDPQFGDRLITMMAALVLVLQIMMVAQRWLITNIRAFGVQSFLLAAIAGTIAHFNHAPHIYFIAALTLAMKAIVLPVVLERLVKRIEIRQEDAFGRVEDFGRLRHEMDAAEEDDFGVGFGGLEAQSQGVADKIGYVLDFRHLVVVRENDGIAFPLQLRDIRGQIETKVYTGANH